MRLRVIIAVALLAALSGNALVASAADGQPWVLDRIAWDEATLKLRGRIDADSIWTAQSAKNEADFGQFADQVGLRRARIGVEGNLAPDTSYIAEIDLANGNVVIRDLYLANDWHGIGESRAGHFREPFSLEGGTSARYLAFLERSAANVFDPARNWGLGLYKVAIAEDASLNMGAFYGGSDQNDFKGGAGSTVGVTAKLTGAPVNHDNGRQLVHYGIAVAERLPLDRDIIIKQRPRSPLLDASDSSSSAFTPTIRLPAHFQHIVNAQLALANGAFWSQAEWYGTFIDQPSADTVFYHGCHADAGYFLTGENRRYDASMGELGPVEVRRPFLAKATGDGRPRGPGAWEIAARFAWVDFIDGDAPATPTGDPSGVQVAELTCGANWYLCDSLRLMFNYTYAEPNLPVSGESSASLFATRLAFYW